jgi:SAM-dependent methyltransferase
MPESQRQEPPRAPLTHCPLCERPLGDRGVRPLTGFERDHIVRCRACGFHFSSLQPSPADYAEVYGAYDYGAEDAARSDLSMQREAEIAQRLLQGRDRARVLDIAAGAGRFLEPFRALGCECFATEFNEEMQAYLRAKGFQTLEGGLFPQGDEGSFDIIVFTEIIEHINNPMPVLRSISALLKPGGRLYVTTPNFNSLERRLLGQDWGMICFPEHITYWTPRDLDCALRGTGLTKASLVVENISPYRIIQALKKGRLKGVVGNVSEQGFSDFAQAKVASSRMLSLAKSTVNRLLRATGLGSSIVAIYDKP